MFRTILLAAAFLALDGSRLPAVEPPDFMMRAVVAGRLVEGRPLSWSTERVQLLGRDGALYDFAAADAKNAKKLPGAYRSYSAEEMKGLLHGEFGLGWDATTTPHFVVAHPYGQWKAWAARLEALYRTFTVYMNVRGARLSEPEYPLAAIVFRNQLDYYHYAATTGTTLAPNTLGHYDPATNRIYLYDAGNGDSGADAVANISTIIHEATHQAAYNTGVHARFAEQPRWAVEGLAMLFETPSVWSMAPTSERASRVNLERLGYFRRTAKSRKANWIGELVASDRRFDSDALAAYAEAWTLTFFLSETRPQQYSAYLADTARRPLFSEYGANDRARDFIRRFGADLALLDSQLQQFVDELP